MAEGWQIGVALLAAGASRRFGSRDKLAQQIEGVMLGEKAAKGFPRALCSHGWVITAARGHPCEPGWIAAGFDPHVNPMAHEGMGTSVALAARLAQHERLDALAIVLADMPNVPTGHFVALIEAANAPGSIATSALDETHMPPAVFGSAHFAALVDCSGDRGARAILARGKVVPCPPDWLVDIDTPEDLAKHGQ